MEDMPGCPCGLGKRRGAYTGQDKSDVIQARMYLFCPERKSELGTFLAPRSGHTGPLLLKWLSLFIVSWKLCRKILQGIVAVIV
jgi:hypothetical protein